VGVLLVNLGTPDATDCWSMRRYLKEFLSDRRVIEEPRWKWWPILNLIILTVRPGPKGRDYDSIWNKDKNEGRDQAEALTARIAAGALGEAGGQVVVDWAMRYGNPSIEDRLAAMKAAGCDRILIAPLYPQYSGATTGTGFDEVARVLGKMRWQPALRTLPAYHDDPAYIAALKTSVEEGLKALPFEPESILASFHSMPERTLHLGDPYHCHCQKTARLLSEALGRDVRVSFQSKLGRAKWLEPATDATLAALPKENIRRIAVIAPGFSADNLETLEEVALRGKETFLEAGGTDFAYLPCLNASAPGIAMLATLLSRELAGWLPAQ